MRKKTQYLYKSKAKKRDMVDKMPLLIVILIVVFIITSLMTFITMEKVVIPEKIETQKTKTSTESGIVKIDIVSPEKEVIADETNIK